MKVALLSILIAAISWSELSQGIKIIRLENRVAQLERAAADRDGAPGKRK